MPEKLAARQRQKQGIPSVGCRTRGLAKGRCTFICVLETTLSLTDISRMVTVQQSIV